MSINEMEKKIETLREWEELLEEAKAQEEMTAGRYICRWTSVLSNRFDSTTFKKEHAEMYKQYTKQTASRRFSIA